MTSEPERDTVDGIDLPKAPKEEGMIRMMRKIQAFLQAIPTLGSLSTMTLPSIRHLACKSKTMSMVW